MKKPCKFYNNGKCDFRYWCAYQNKGTCNKFERFDIHYYDRQAMIKAIEKIEDMLYANITGYKE